MQEVEHSQSSKMTMHKPFHTLRYPLTVSNKAVAVRTVQLEKIVIRTTVIKRVTPHLRLLSLLTARTAHVKIHDDSSSKSSMLSQRKAEAASAQGNPMLQLSHSLEVRVAVQTIMSEWTVEVLR